MMFTVVGQSHPDSDPHYSAASHTTNPLGASTKAQQEPSKAQQKDQENRHHKKPTTSTSNIRIHISTNTNHSKLPSRARRISNPILSPETEIIAEPTTHDVLLGRGGHNNKFIGNERLREFALEYVEAYVRSNKIQKTHIAKTLVHRVTSLDPPGRFIKKLDDGMWVDIGTDLARDKASQVLRDAVRDVYGCDVTDYPMAPAVGVEDISPHADSCHGNDDHEVVLDDDHHDDYKHKKRDDRHHDHSSKNHNGKKDSNWNTLLDTAALLGADTTTTTTTTTTNHDRPSQHPKKRHKVENRAPKTNAATMTYTTASTISSHSSSPHHQHTIPTHYQTFSLPWNIQGTKGSIPPETTTSTSSASTNLSTATIPASNRRHMQAPSPLTSSQQQHHSVTTDGSTLQNPTLTPMNDLGINIARHQLMLESSTGNSIASHYVPTPILSVPKLDVSFKADDAAADEEAAGAAVNPSRSVHSIPSNGTENPLESQTRITGMLQMRLESLRQRYLQEVRSELQSYQKYGVISGISSDFALQAYMSSQPHLIRPMFVDGSITPKLYEQQHRNHPPSHSSFQHPSSLQQHHAVLKHRHPNPQYHPIYSVFNPGPESAQTNPNFYTHTHSMHMNTGMNSESIASRNSRSTASDSIVTHSNSDAAVKVQHPSPYPKGDDSRMKLLCSTIDCVEKE